MTATFEDSRSVLDVIAQACNTYKDLPAFTCMGRTLSYTELDKYSRAFAAFLQNCDHLQPGDRIAVQMPNILQYPIVMFGVMRAGMILVNTNPLYTARELKHQLCDSGAKMLIVLANLAASAAEIVGETPVEQVVVTELGDMHGPLKRLLINQVVKLKKMVPAVSFQHQVSFRSALSRGEALQWSPVKREPQDVAVLQYTGGTTGVAKGAMLTHRNLVCNMEQVRNQLDGYLRIAQECYMAPLPLYHIYAFTLHCMALVATGNHNILIPNPRDLDSLTAAMKAQKITGFVGLNTLFSSLCAHQGFKRLDFSHLQLTASGGMALTSEAAALWKRITGCEVSEGYGLTETSPVVSCNIPGKIQQGTVGPPVIYTEVKVTDQDAKTLPVGERGLLWVRGPQVMKGYWQKPEATAEVLDAEGWFNTGDVAIIQADGYIRIVDRIKDVIIVSGFNVYPNEIEEVLSQCPGVKESAVVGVKDVHSGEVVKAFVVRSDKNVTVDDIMDYCRHNLTGYKLPKKIEFRDELPKSNVGKILRRELKEEKAAV